MAESPKRAPSTGGPHNKTSSLDNDFGEDFLASWKSLKGKNSIDFDVETIPGNGKKSFNFDKLDVFELGGGFDKISSFKMDMSDLDFSSPCKDDKTKNPSKDSVNKETKQDKFSFTFDFNELESFNIDSNLLKGEKKPRKCTDSDDCSSKHDGAQDSRSNSGRSLDAFENKATKKLSTAQNLATAPAEPAIKHDITNGFCPSTSSDPEHQNMSHGVMGSSEKQATIEEGSIASYQDLSDGKYSTKQHTQKPAQNISLRSIYFDASENKIFPSSGIGLVPLDCPVTRKASNQDNSVGSIDASHSGSSSPANSSNSRCSLKLITTKANISAGAENQQGNRDEACGGSIVGESNNGHKDESVSEMDAALKNPNENKQTVGKQNTSSDFLPSSLNTLISNKILKAKSTFAPQFSTLSKSTKNVSQPASIKMSKQNYSMPNKKKETKILCTLNERRESIQNHEQAGNQACVISKSFGKTGPKDVSTITGGEKNIEVCDTSDSCVQVQPSNMPSKVTASSSNKDKNHISSLLPTKSPITCSIELKDVCPKDDKRLTKLNITSANSTMRTETKSDKFDEENLQSSLCTESKVVGSTITRRIALLSPPLKRKAPEESKEDTRISNQLKRIGGSSAERKKSLEASAQSDKKLVPQTESPEGPHKEIVIGSQNLSNDFEVPILIEDDGNVEKAEAFAKELDDICTMLKKKHEEAKEILVRAVVNNNTLLMLNHPMFDEKIRALQKFATSLQSKEF